MAEETAGYLVPPLYQHARSPRSAKRSRRVREDGGFENSWTIM